MQGGLPCKCCSYIRGPKKREQFLVVCSMLMMRAGAGNHSGFHIQCSGASPTTNYKVLGIVCYSYTETNSRRIFLHTAFTLFGF